MAITGALRLLSSVLLSSPLSLSLSDARRPSIARMNALTLEVATVKRETNERRQSRRVLGAPLSRAPERLGSLAVHPVH